MSTAVLVPVIAGCGAGGTSTTTTTTRASTSYQTPAERLTSHLEGILVDISKTAGEVESGDAGAQRQARSTLSGLQRNADELRDKARAELPGTDWARPVIIQGAAVAASAAARLESLTQTTPVPHATVQAIRSALGSVAAVLGQAHSVLHHLTATEAARDIETLLRLFESGASGSSAATGSSTATGSTPF